MKRGKRTCEILKDVRRKVAQENDIPLVERECTHEGDCRGTCPYCESEVRYLERELSKRRALGKAVTVAGIAVSSMMMGACHGPKTPAPAAGNEPEPAVETTTQQVPEEADGQEVPPPPPPGQSDPYEMLGVFEEIPDPDENSSDPAPNSCSQKAAQLSGTDDWETGVGVGGDVEVDWPSGDTPSWTPTVAPAQYLKERLTVPRDFLRSSKYDNAYISLIIDGGDVKEVVFKPKNGSPSAEEKAFQEEATRILKSMPKWEGGNTTASYEIPVRDLR